MPFAVRTIAAAALLAGAIAGTDAHAQETREQEMALRQKALDVLSSTAPRRLFGAVTGPAAGQPRIVGEYWKGCYMGGLRFPSMGDHWQVMRLSRNRNWGHPHLITFLERFADRAAEVTGWPGILIGDMSQPRGGPMLTGHASHQLGIEADIWLRPMPKERFDPEEVEEVLSTDLRRADGKDVDPRVYTRQHFALLKLAASSPEVERVFVNAAIKKALCRDAGEDRAWLQKVRPILGHTYHFHIRLACPPGESGCIPQTPVVPGEGCRPQDLNYWLTDSMVKWKAPTGPGRQMAMSSMPKECQTLATLPSLPPPAPPAKAKPGPPSPAGAAAKPAPSAKPVPAPAPAPVPAKKKGLFTR